MATQAKTQIQIRIDPQVKEEARKILESIGMDTSTAVNIFLRRIIQSGTFPIDLRDINGFRPGKAQELREAISEASRNKKSFKNVKDLLVDLHS